MGPDRYNQRAKFAMSRLLLLLLAAAVAAAAAAPDYALRVAR